MWYVWKSKAFEIPSVTHKTYIENLMQSFSSTQDFQYNWTNYPREKELKSEHYLVYLYDITTEISYLRPITWDYINLKAL